MESVQTGLRQVEARMRSQADGYHPDLDTVLQHLLASGGKRIRPTVTLLTGNLLGSDPARLITLAAAIELLHTATLVHDDLIDGALFRRGIPTLNAQWSPAATVLTGDFIFARAAKLAAETESIAIMNRFSTTLSTIVNGEITQMFTSRGLASRENYYRRIYAKTASLFETATAAAAVLSAADEAQVEHARCYGYEIGMAFQIVDDILDFTGEQATLGKPVASDLRQGLVTLPALYYLEAHPQDGDLRSILNSDHCDEPCLERLIKAIRASGAIEQTFAEARQYVQRGLAALGALPDRPQRQALADLAQYIVQRPL
jgi:geranylgeranyl pyrophosphate synthase